MLDKVVGFITQYSMIIPKDRIVVGFSGGADSTALLHILSRIKNDIGFELFAAHLDHGLRGTQAKEDADFCAAFCEEHNIPFHLKEVDILSAADKYSMSVEEAGRKFRYDFFEDVLFEVKANKIATAHHKDDQAETILYNIIRGTGIHGLGGIKPVRENKLIRPLLCVSRNEVEKYIMDNNLCYRTDSTNNDAIYTRNRIRHYLIPAITKEFNPNFVDTLVRMGQAAGEEDDFLTEYCQELLPKYIVLSDNCVSISLNFLENHSSIQKRVVRHGISMLKKGLKDISYKHVDDVVKLALHSNSGSRLMLPYGMTVVKNYYSIDIMITNNAGNVKPFDEAVPVPGSVALNDLGIIVEVKLHDQKHGIHMDAKSNPFSVYIDRGAVVGQLRVRQRKNGDRFVPFGMNGSKKLKDFLIDKKIPRDKRDSIPLIVDDENIIWVAGIQISEKYKVSTKTTEIINLRIFEAQKTQA